MAACSPASSNSVAPSDGNSPPAPRSECISFKGANEQVFGWKDVPHGVYVGDNPVGDHSKMYAIRIGDAVWLTSAPPDGSDGGLTFPVNDPARAYDSVLGADVDVEGSVWADLASMAEGASASCG